MKFLTVIFMLSSFQLIYACQGEPALAELEQGTRITARAQNGVRFVGKNALPVVVSIKPLLGTQVALKVLGQAKEMKNTSSLFDRMSGKAPNYEDHLIPKAIDLRPEKILDSALRYELQIKDGDQTLQIELLLTGGMVKGCSGGAATIEKI